MAIDYSEDVNRIISAKLKDWISIIKRDRCFIKENHEIEWSEIRAEIINFIKQFVSDILRVEGEHIHFEPFGNRKRNINSFIMEIESLLSKFQNSPPFTIYYLIRVLSLDEGFNCLTDYKIDKRYNGLKTYNRKTIDLITKTETSVVVNNVYYEEDGEFKIPSMNKVHAIKFLKLLIKCLEVESSCDDVINDMEYYKSANLIGKDYVRNGDESADNDSIMKLVKIK
ncbi:hypothetical protein CANINC_000397 [Pichia inconspicua]|uniref:Uncharacterized protein n=1 Tax=Pichia inconspicua TaxID=52247 RepID=A0A4T0X698_9ASCO|nr:hypothetical protein CANINC_000397 [[Candida] inconspicua]